MRSSCIFLNLGRGPIVDEQALYNALVRNQIAAAGLDVLCEEPMSADNPLVQFKDSKRLLITPHIAWASVEARTHLMEIIHGQVKEFFCLRSTILFIPTTFFAICNQYFSVKFKENNCKLWVKCFIIAMYVIFARRNMST